MSQLNVRLDERRLRALRRYAARRRTPITWLVRDYFDHLLAGGDPVAPPAGDAPSAAELTWLAAHGGAFDWLDAEPELYSLEDGEAV
ncbi:MAG: hypothetical protein ACRDF0_11535 [Candidatus Limnocylindria bacterium]